MKRLVLFIALIVPVAASAGGRLSRAERLFEEMEYDRALALADRVLRSAGNGPAELVQALSIRGLCQAAKGDQKDSMETFRALLSIDPDFRLPTTLSPRLTAGFYQAVAYAKAQKPITLVHRPPQLVPGQRVDTLRVTLLADPLGLVKSIRLRLHRSKGRRAVLAAVTGLGEISMRLPGRFTAANLRYHIEALNGHGSVLLRLGSRQDPLRPVRPGAVAAATGPPPGSAPDAPGDEDPPAAQARPANGSAAIPAAGIHLAAQGGPAPVSGALRPDRAPAEDRGLREDESRPAVWYESWWFWTAVGVVVVGATAGTAAALTADGPARGPVNYGIELR